MTYTKFKTANGAAIAAAQEVIDKQDLVSIRAPVAEGKHLFHASVALTCSVLHLLLLHASLLPSYTSFLLQRLFYMC